MQSTPVIGNWCLLRMLDLVSLNNYKEITFLALRFTSGQVSIHLEPRSLFT